MQKLLIDTNVLLLWIIGSFDRASIRSYRRTAQFTPGDFDLLITYRSRYRQTLTTAPILTEASNLLGNDFHVEIASTLIDLGRGLIEVAKPKGEVFEIEGFDRLGFSDCTTLAAMDGETTLLTDDVQLHAQASLFEFDAVNFNHLRNYR